MWFSGDVARVTQMTVAAGGKQEELSARFLPSGAPRDTKRRFVLFMRDKHGRCGFIYVKRAHQLTYSTLLYFLLNKTQPNADEEKTVCLSTVLLKRRYSFFHVLFPQNRNKRGLFRFIVFIMISKMG